MNSSRIRNCSILILVVLVFGLFLQAKEGRSRKQFVDVSHIVIDGMKTYKGIPPPIISAHLTREESVQRYAPGTEFLISKIEMVANTGTYIDAPYHRYVNGKDLSELDLEDLAYIEAVIVAVPDKTIKIDESYFESLDLDGKALLIRTDWSENWGEDIYFENHPHLTEGAARLLVRKKVKLVGIDSYNIDDVAGKTRPVHSLLLAANIPIVEHLCNLKEVPADRNIEFNAVPIRIKAFSTFPVRAFVAW